MPYNIIKQRTGTSTNVNVSGVEIDFTPLTGPISNNNPNAALATIASNIADLSVADPSEAIEDVVGELAGISTDIQSVSTNISNANTQLTSIKSSQSTISSNLTTIKTNTGNIKTSLDSIKTAIENQSGGGGGTDVSGIVTAINNKTIPDPNTKLTSIATAIDGIDIPDTSTALSGIATAISNKTIPDSTSNLSTINQTLSLELSAISDDLNELEKLGALNDIVNILDAKVIPTTDVSGIVGAISNKVIPTTDVSGIIEAINSLKTPTPWTYLGSSTGTFTLSNVDKYTEFKVIYVLSNTANRQLCIVIPKAELGQAFLTGYYYDANYNATVGVTTTQTQIKNDTAWTHIKYGSNILTSATFKVYAR